MRRARRNLYALKRERREKREYTVGSRLLPNRIGYVIGTLIFWVTRFSDNNVSKHAICMIWEGICIYSKFLLTWLLPGHKMRLSQGFNVCAVWTINNVTEEAYSGKSPPLLKMGLASCYCC